MPSKYANNSCDKCYSVLRCVLKFKRFALQKVKMTIFIGLQTSHMAERESGLVR